MAGGAAQRFPTFKSEESRARYIAAYDAVLREWPVDYQTLELPTRLGPTHVIVSGPPDAPPLVLLHSFAGTATVWRLNVETLSRRYRTFAVDVIGQPGKSQAVRKIRHRRDFAGWYIDLLDGLGIARASIVGCSFGAFLALSQAALTPERIDRLVLISPAGSFVGLSWRFTYAMLTSRLRRRVRRLLGDKRPPSLADLSARQAPRDPAWAKLMSVTMAEAAKVSIINAGVFRRSELQKIRAPALLLIGEQERLYDPHQTLTLAQLRMPGLKGAIVPKADHIAAMAQPDDVNARILGFLAAGVA